ncbi:IS21 family transposase [Aliiglaciecola sp. LCG003]|uniref:IS21 family transposase n=1 Tax=Aliiglaciecola sp. LCG003 TaxID=3053655 RepID=UPI0025745FE8|nr:IS21 family transposase [Aliiglaciecola sp. LCG003]WJG07955.1 IS21 family transposase [Aliiglaciecola sp. LCG003]
MKKSTQFLEIVRLNKQTEFSNREIGRAVGASHQTVGRCLKKFKVSGLTLAEIMALEPDEIMKIRYPKYGRRIHNFIIPDWGEIYNRLLKKHITLLMIFIEYAEAYGMNAMKYSTFCREYRKHCKLNKLSMKLIHKPAETMQVDYAGITYKATFAAKPIQFFVAVLPYSGLMYARGTLRQTTEDWIEGHIGAFKAFGGVPEIVIPDNAKAVVSQPAPNLVINPKYEACTNYYGVTVLPARPKHPQDKADAEGHVKIFTFDIMPELRKQVFRTLDDMNDFIAEEVAKVNSRTLSKSSVSRQDIFDTFERTLLNPLPDSAFEPLECILNISVPSNYSILYDEHHYSVPHRYANKKVQVHIHKNKVVVWLGHKEIACHERSFEKGGYTRVETHMHPEHLWFDDKPVEYFVDWAEKSFACADITQFVKNLFNSKYKKSRRGNQYCRLLQKLSKSYSTEDLSGACAYAISNGHTNNWELFTYILKSGVFKPKVEDDFKVLPSSIVRGGDYYNATGVQL